MDLGLTLTLTLTLTPTLTLTLTPTLTPTLTLTLGERLVIYNQEKQQATKAPACKGGALRQG